MMSKTLLFFLAEKQQAKGKAPRRVAKAKVLSMPTISTVDDKDVNNLMNHLDNAFDVANSSMTKRLMTPALLKELRAVKVPTLRLKFPCKYVNTHDGCDGSD